MTELHKWEMLDEAASRGKRMRVPGGWIYSLPNLPAVHVPDPETVSVKSAGGLSEAVLEILESDHKEGLLICRLPGRVFRENMVFVQKFAKVLQDHAPSGLKTLVVEDNARLSIITADEIIRLRQLGRLILDDKPEQENQT